MHKNNPIPSFAEQFVGKLEAQHRRDAHGAWVAAEGIFAVATAEGEALYRRDVAAQEEPQRRRERTRRRRQQGVRVGRPGGAGLHGDAEAWRCGGESEQSEAGRRWVVSSTFSVMSSLASRYS